MNVTKCQPNYSTGAIGYKKQNSPAFGIKLGTIPFDSIEKSGEEVIKAFKDSLPKLRSEYGDDVSVSFQVGKKIYYYVKMLVGQDFGELRLRSGEKEPHIYQKTVTLRGKKNITGDRILDGIQNAVQDIANRNGNKYEKRKDELKRSLKAARQRAELQEQVGIE